MAGISPKPLVMVLPEVQIERVPDPEASGSAHTHTQGVSADSWTIQHNMGKYPSVTVVDSAGTQVNGIVEYSSENTVKVSFTAPFSGTAYLN